MNKWHALVLAGSRGQGDPVAQRAGVSHKAFASLAGRAMIDFVIETLQQTEAVADVSVSIERDAPSLPTGVTRLDAASSPAKSVLSAFEALPLPLLITTADNPLLSAETLTFFLDSCETTPANIVAGLCRREVVENAKAGGSRTYFKFSDGAVSGCNLFALKATEAGKAVQFWTTLEENRKKAWKIAFEIGPLSVIQYLVGRLSSETALRRLEKKLGISAAFVYLQDPLAAHDVDKEADMVFAEAILAARNGRF